MKTFLKISLFFLLLTQIQYPQWVPIGPPFGHVWSLATSGSNVFAGTNFNGLYRSTDDGQTWAQTSLNAGTIWSIAIDGSNIFAGTTTRLFRSIDDGQTWAQTSLNAGTIWSIAIDGSNIFAGTDTGVFLSIDNGQNWTHTSLKNCMVFGLAVSGPNIFAGTNSGVYRSTNSSQTWHQTPLDSIWGGRVAANGSNVMAGGGIGEEALLFYSSNNGDTWSQTNALYFEIGDIIINGSDGFASSRGVYYSTNNGQSWINKSQGLPAGSMVSALAISGDYIYAGLESGFSVWRRRLNEITPVELSSFSASVVNSEIILNWTTASETNNQGFDIEHSFDNQKFSKIGFVPGFGTTTEAKSYSFSISDATAGVHYYRLKQIDFDGTFKYSEIVAVEVKIPGTYSLFQNYPNPFNPSTTINYAIPSSEFVTLKVYDILGNEVAALVNEQRPVGSYEVEFNAAGLASGIYYYKIQAGSFVETKKMILMK